MIIAEVCIYILFSSKQLKMEEHKAKQFSQIFIKSLEFLKRNLESLFLPSLPYFLCPFSHSFQKPHSDLSSRFHIVPSPFLPPNSIKSVHCTQIHLSPRAFLLTEWQSQSRPFYRHIYIIN